MNAPIFSRVTRKKVCILLFNSEIGKKNKQEVLHSAEGKVKKDAKEWRRIRIHHQESSHSSARVFDKTALSHEAFGIVHN